ncbi:MAG: deoxyhypusine synthase family protein [Alphaproteobacteria bacterium]|nr:deoxyhypusine synthase family protein [Alphaproteobacteria bacterium]
MCAAPSPISDFIRKHYLHFNAAALQRAAEGYKNFLGKKNGKMMVTLGGAMSTAELGKLLAEMIRQDKVAAITCTGANLEEDLFNAVAHDFYRAVPNYRDLSPEQEEELLNNKYNRVTDTCIPEEEAMRKVEGYVIPLWEEAAKNNKPLLPHEFLYKVILNPNFQKEFQIPREDSWMLAAAEKNLPVFVPGWEDSTLGNMIVALKYKGEITLDGVKSGLHYMDRLIDWYKATAAKHPMGFFQIGGGISGDFPICVVPLITQDLKDDVAVWDFFCQISDAVESYGGYSGAAPSEKITWGKLTAKSERYNINSDATIVAPLIFAYVLGL